ncbi:MAG: hypothetical protein PHY99_03135 [Bacteroidales bacterium]|nr:hypothetical protein [Bacteroidales bacterium]
MKRLLTFVFVVSFFYGSQVCVADQLTPTACSDCSEYFISDSGFGPGDGAARLIEAANKSGKTVFLVVYDKTGADKEKAMSIAKEAKAKKPDVTQIVEFNTTDVANKDLIARYRTAGAPLPLILVIDINGTATGGFLLAEATSEGLLNLIPSPKFSEILKGLSAQKCVFLVAYKGSMAQKAVAVAKCTEAVKMMSNGASIVELNIEDKGEESMVKNLKIDPAIIAPEIHTINKAGQVTGVFNSDTDPAQLVKSAKKSSTGSCCPAGGSCAPAKK